MFDDNKIFGSKPPCSSLETYGQVLRLEKELQQSEQQIVRYMDSLEDRMARSKKQMEQYLKEKGELKLVEEEVCEEREKVAVEMENFGKVEPITKRERSKKKNRKRYNWKIRENKNLKTKLDELNMENKAIVKRKETVEKLILKEEEKELDLVEQLEGATHEYERGYEQRMENERLCERVLSKAEGKEEKIEGEWVRSLYLLPPVKKVVKWERNEKDSEKEHVKIKDATQTSFPESLWNKENLKLAKNLISQVSWEYMWDLDIIPSFKISLSREKVKILKINREKISENLNWNFVEHFKISQTEKVIAKQKIQEDLEKEDKYEVREVIQSLEMESLKILDKKVKIMSDSETGYESKTTSEEDQTTSCEEETEVEEEEKDEIYRKRGRSGKLRKKAKMKMVASKLNFLPKQKILRENIKLKKCLQEERDKKVKEDREYMLKIKYLEETVEKLEEGLIEDRNQNLEQQREVLEEKYKGEINKIRRSVIEKVQTEKLNKFVSIKNQLFSLIDKYKEESGIREDILQKLKFNLLKEDKELVKALLGILGSFGENKKIQEEKEREVNNLKNDLENLKKNNLDDLEKLKNKMEKEILIVNTKLENWKNLYSDMKINNYNGVNFLYRKIKKLREECEKLKYNNYNTNCNVGERHEWKYKVTILEKKNREIESNIRREREEKMKMETEVISRDQNLNKLEIQMRSVEDRCVKLQNLYQHQKRLYVAANSVIKNFKEKEQLRSANKNMDRKDGEISEVREDLKVTRKSLDEKVEEIKKIKMNWENSKEANEKYKNRLKARIKELQEESLEKKENLVSEGEMRRLKTVERGFSEWHDDVIRDLDFFNNWLSKIENKFCNGRELGIREDLEKFSKFIKEELCRYLPDKMKRVRTETVEEYEERRKPESEIEKLKKRLKLVKPGSKDFLRLSLKIRGLEEENGNQTLRLGNIY